MRRPDRWSWRPQAGPQKSLVDCPVKEIFFGGTRGGGKRTQPSSYARAPVSFMTAAGHEW